MSTATKQMARIANRTILKPQGSFTVTNNDATTQVIVRNVLDGYRASKDQLREFARALVEADRELPVLYNIWDFVRNEIAYKLDPADWQWIKTPEATWDTGFADCKSKSIFVGALLNAFGIPFDFRFTSYSDSPTYTHVYIVAHFGNDITIPIDPVFPQFGEEKAFTYKKDYPMKIAQIGALPESRKPTHGGKLSQPASGKVTHKAIPEGKDIFKMTSGELMAHLHLQRLRLKQMHVRAIKGIGSLADEVLQDQIELTEDIIRNINNPTALDVIADQSAEGKYETARAVQGIGATQRQAVRQQRRDDRKADKDKRVSQGRSTGAASKPDANGKPKGIKKIVEAVKKAGQAAVKAATFVPRTIIKGIIEISLPKAAPNFLYLFVNQPELIAKLPDAARKKRKKQEELFVFITKNIGMKSDHVMAILRNGIIERTGKEPEQLLAAQLGGAIAGIGLIDDAFKILVEIIEKIVKVIGKKGPKFEKGDAPDVAADFPAAGMTESRQLAKEVEAQKADILAPAGESENEYAANEGGAARTPRKGYC